MNLNFRRNLGNIDRGIRIIVGLIVIYLAFFSNFIAGRWAVSALAILGTLMIAEGWLGY